MSITAAKSLRERVRRKWPIPALFLAAAVLAGSLFRLRSEQVRSPVEACLAQLASRVEDGYYTAAIDYGDRLAKRDDLSDTDRPAIRLHLARAHYLRAERERRTTTAEAAVVQSYYASAFAGGAKRWSEDLVRWGNTHLWQGEYALALGRYQEALAVAESPALPIRRRIIELSLSRLQEPPAKALALLEEFIEDAEADIDASYWAVATRVDLLSAEGRDEEARSMVEALRDRFELTPRRTGHAYLTALVQYRSGQFDATEAQLRHLRNALAATDELNAATGWLLGRVILSDGRLQSVEEALSFFRDVIDADPESIYGAASRLGVAEGLAAAGRYEESMEEFGRVAEMVAESETLRASPLVSADVIRTAATVVGERARCEGILEPALQFYEFASSLLASGDELRLAQYLEIIGDLRTGVARALRAKADGRPAGAAADAAEREQWQADARYLLLEAAETFLRLARLDTLEESQSADAVWRAANLFDEAGATRRTISTLERFLTERPEHELAPQVLLRLGQARQSLGMYQEAIDAYQENLRRFARTPDAGSGLVPLARCYMALVPQSTEMAVRTLAVILEDSPIFTPEAPEFRDALFLLGEIHHADAQFETSVAVLEEALERYPTDERTLRSKFLLADAYRQSALELQGEAADSQAASHLAHLRAARTARFKRAAALFAELVQEFDRPGHAGPGEAELIAVFAKLARLYQADCLFELGQFADAVALYESAAFIYREDLAALSSYVQIINCRLSLGQSAEARTALRRARYLLRIMPEKAFQSSSAGASVGQGRGEWERYMDWLDQARLF